MKGIRFLLPVPALGMTMLLLWPGAESYGFTKNGGMLDTSFRDFRIFNTFQDRRANDNINPSPQFPGALGAEMAIWKGYVEWGSGTHGDGTGDPHQPNLGDGGANFDPAYAGRSTAIGGLNDNVVFATQNCMAGVIGLTETPVTDGWRIRFCEEWNWHDGPAPAGVAFFDIQGVAAHEFGHALGLSHSAVVNATMFPTGSMGDASTNLRSLHADDIAGIQCIYGVKDPNKPEITAVGVASGMITLDGLNFDPLDNEVWFTPDVATDVGVDPIVRVTGAASSMAGTQITVAIPAGAGPGDVLVKVPGGTGGHTLSNAFPSDLGVTQLFAAPSAVFRNGMGVNPPCLSSLTPPAVGTDWQVQVDATGIAGATVTSIRCYFSGMDGPVFGFGQILVDTSSGKCFKMNMAASGGADLYTVPIISDATLIGLTSAMQGIVVTGGTFQLCNALDVQLGI